MRDLLELDGVFLNAGDISTVKPEKDAGASRKVSKIPLRGFDVRDAKFKISLSNKCNLECRYCDKKTIECASKGEVNIDAILLTSEAFYKKGFRHVYIGGGSYGEPLLFEELPSIMAELRDIGYNRITLMTNGVLLKNKFNDLFLSGLTDCSINLGTLDERIYTWLYGANKLRDVIEGIKEVSGYVDVKIISVLLKGINDIEPRGLINFCAENKINLQFNELVKLSLSEHFYDAHHMDLSVLMDEIDKYSHYVEIVKMDGKHKYYLDDIVVTLNFCGKYSSYLYREAPPVVHYDGKITWLRSDNIIYTPPISCDGFDDGDKKIFFEEVSKSFDLRLTNIGPDVLLEYENYGLFSKADW